MNSYCGFPGRRGPCHQLLRNDVAGGSQGEARREPGEDRSMFMTYCQHRPGHLPSSGAHWRRAEMIKYIDGDGDLMTEWTLGDNILLPPSHHR